MGGLAGLNKKNQPGDVSSLIELGRPDEICAKAVDTDAYVAGRSYSKRQLLFDRNRHLS